MNWNVDDPELLDAALRLLEEPADSGHDVDASTPAMTASSSGDNDGDLDNLPTKTVNRSRERRRKEMRSLRAEAQSLCAQLDALQRRHELALAPCDLRNTSPSNGGVAWADVARRQFRSRRKAEQLNARLRATVNAQAAAARDLVVAIHRLGQRHEFADLIPAISRVNLPIEIGLKVSEHEQLARLERLCRESHVAFSATHKFHTHKVGFLDVQHARGPCDETLVDTFTSWFVPFQVDSVANAAWDMKTLPSMEDEGHLFQQDFEVQPNRIVANFNAKTTAGPRQGEFDGKYVAKRFRDSNRDTIIASYMYTEPRGYGLSDFDGIGLHEDTWVRIRNALPLAEDLSKGASSQTQIQVSRRLRIAFGACDTRRNQERVKALLEFLMQFSKGELAWTQFKIEDLILHSAPASIPDMPQ